MVTKNYEALDFGPLPVDVINRTLGMDLEPGAVHMSAQAHKHAAKDHPDDYPICCPLVRQTIADPTFIGQSPSHRDNFMMIRRIPGGGGALLVAVSVERDGAGRYRVRSFYMIGEGKITNRRAAGHLRPARK